MDDTVRKLNKIFLRTTQFDNVRSAVIAGDNTVTRNVVKEAVTLDDAWITNVENGLYAIESVVHNPKKFIKDQEFVVDVEKAKKTTARTVQHLASHTKNIAAITSDGIRPKRVLTVEMEEDIGIYENRFVTSLIDRLLVFVERRYNDILSKMALRSKSSVSTHTKFNIGNREVECDLNLVGLTPPVDAEQVLKNEGIVQRIEVIRKRIRTLVNTEFHRSMAGYKPVYAPINKTNIILMNVDYNACYKLWLFISSYTFVGYSIDMSNTNLPVDSDYFADVASITAMAVNTLLGTLDTVERTKPDKIKKYKVGTSFEFLPKLKKDKSKLTEDVINEFYYAKMREALSHAVKQSLNTQLSEERQLDMSVQRFFKALSTINNRMLDDVIDKQQTKSDDSLQDTLAQKKREVLNQQRRAQRYKTLARLKQAESAKAVKQQEQEEAKLAKMKESLNKAKQAEAKRKRILAQKAKAEAEKAKKEQLLLAEQRKQQEQNATVQTQQPSAEDKPQTVVAPKKRKTGAAKPNDDGDIEVYEGVLLEEELKRRAKTTKSNDLDTTTQPKTVSNQIESVADDTHAAQKDEQTKLNNDETASTSSEIPSDNASTEQQDTETK